MPHEPPPDPSPILDLIEAFRTSKSCSRYRLGVLTAWRRRPATAEALARDLA